MRRLTLLLIFQVILLSALLALLDDHAIRASLFNVIDTPNRTDFSWSPSRAPDWYRSDPPEQYQNLRSEAKTAMAQGDSDIERFFNLMLYTRELGTNKQNQPVSADSIDEVKEQIQEGRRANCAHYSWLLSAYLQSSGESARILGLDADDGLGGNGHALVEVWVPSHQKWAVLDPLNSAMFFSDSRPLSLLEIRDQINSGEKGSPVIRQGEQYEISKANLIPYYRSTIQNVTLDGAGNLISRYENRYGILSFMAPLFDQLPRAPQRAIANLFGEGDLRIHYLDDHAHSYHPFLHKSLFWLIAALTGGIVLSILAIVRKRSRSRMGHENA